MGEIEPYQGVSHGIPINGHHLFQHLQKRTSLWHGIVHSFEHQLHKWSIEPGLQDLLLVTLDLQSEGTQLLLFIMFLWLVVLKTIPSLVPLA